MIHFLSPKKNKKILKKVLTNLKMCDTIDTVPKGTPNKQFAKERLNTMTNNITKERKFVYILQYYIGDNEWEGKQRFTDAEEVEKAGLEYLKKFFEIFKWLYNEIAGTILDCLCKHTLLTNCGADEET